MASNCQKRHNTDHKCGKSYMYMYIMALLSVAGFLPDSVTYNVNPDLWVLIAVEELVSGSRLDKIGEAVSMLEHLHSHYPEVRGERDYINLIVDMKTKVGRQSCE